MPYPEDKKEPVGQIETARQCGTESAREEIQATTPTDKREYKQTVRILVKMLVTVFLCEAAVMTLLGALPLKRSWHVIADPILLTILSTPLLYWLLVRPVWRSLRQRTCAVEALRKERNKAQMYLNIAGVILAALDRQGIVTMINRTGRRILGGEEGEILGKNWFDSFVPDAERNDARSVFDDLTARNPASFEYFESAILTSNCQERIIAWHIAVLRDGGGNAVGTLSSGEDITQRRQMEEDLRRHREHLEELVEARTTELTKVNRQLLEEISRRRRLEKELLSVVERERQRTGRELHDGIGQQLTGIAFMVEALGQKLSGKSLSEEASYADKINRRIHHAAEQTHTLVKGLQPIDLERSGLAFALQELAADTEQLFNVSCTFVCEKPVCAPGVTVATNLYRIAQEAITNAIKHGKARTITIALAGSEEALTLQVDNDGLAFPAGRVPGKGMGLSIMHYRAEMIEGSLDIRKGADGGTSVTCVVSNKAHA